jgi:hypothetical protein
MRLKEMAFGAFWGIAWILLSTWLIGSFWTPNLYITLLVHGAYYMVMAAWHWSKERMEDEQIEVWYQE